MANKQQPLANRILRAFWFWQPSDGLVTVGAGLAVGLTAGASVWLFKKMIDLVHLAFFDLLGTYFGRLESWTIILIPALGGILAGLLVHHFIGEERHHGVAGIMESVALAGGRLRYHAFPPRPVRQFFPLVPEPQLGRRTPPCKLAPAWARYSDRNCTCCW